jgi:hypothetical protein
MRALAIPAPAWRKVRVRGGEARGMIRSLVAGAVLAASLSLPASASCQLSMVGAYRISCETAAQSGDDAGALDACRSEADRIAACERDGQPLVRGAFLRARALDTLARAYANTNQRARARAAYVESAASLERFARQSGTGAADRHEARAAAAKSRAAAAAL